MTDERSGAFRPGQAPISVSARARPLGRTLRVLAGAGLLALVWPHYLTASPAAYLKIAAGILGVLALYALLHLAIAKYGPRLNRWVGAVLAPLPVVLVFLLGGGIGQIAVLSYLGASLLLDGITGDPGCEVMALPGVMFKDRTHLACVVFTPIDWVERKLSRRNR